MEWEQWKQKGTETFFDVAAAFVGGWLVKKGLKGLSPIKQWGKSLFTIRRTKKDAHYGVELAKAVIHFSQEPMWIMDINGNFEYGNPAWCDLFGFDDTEEAKYMGWMRCVPDEHIEMMMQRNRQFAANPNNFRGEVELMHIHTKAEIKRYCTTHLILDENKKPLKSLGILKKINQ